MKAWNYEYHVTSKTCSWLLYLDGTILYYLKTGPDITEIGKCILFQPYYKACLDNVFVPVQKKLNCKSQVTPPILTLLRPGPDVPALLGVGAAVGEGEGGGEVQHALVLGVLQQARAAAACHG